MANFATVKKITANGVTVRFDGEIEDSTKEYPVSSAYIPKIGDRVRCEEIGNSYLITGTFGGPITPEVKPAITTLAANATLANVITKINEIINWL